MSETGREVGISRRRHPKNIVSSPCQYLGTVGCLQICRTLWSTSLCPDNLEHGANLQSHQAARRSAMTALHHQACLRWCQQHVHWNLNMCVTWSKMADASAGVVSTGGDGLLVLTQRECKILTYRSLQPNFDFLDRGVPELKDYFYRDHALLIWDAIGAVMGWRAAHCSRMVSLYLQQ
ncbi:hypothetical protein AOLI_G00109700 [Acnodon oligacanthus]